MYHAILKSVYNKYTLTLERRPSLKTWTYTEIFSHKIEFSLSLISTVSVTKYHYESNTLLLLYMFKKPPPYLNLLRCHNFD